MARRVKTALLVLAATAGLLLSIFAGILSPGTAFAAGEKYEFQDASTIIGKGGDFPQDMTFKLANGSYKATFTLNGPRVTVSRSWSIGGVTRTADKVYSGIISTTGSATQGQNIVGNITIGDPRGVGPASQAPTDKDKDGLLDDEEKPVCEASPNPMTWIVCPMFNTMTEFGDWVLTNIIVPFIRPSPVGLNPNDKSTGAVYQIWSVMRVYADIILVILLLVAVLSQAYGGGIVEAYTAKRMLPRIVVAAILINISIYIVAFAIDMSNVIGAGIADIITTPLIQTGNFNFEPNAKSFFAIGSLQLVMTGITAFFVSSGTFLTLLPYILVLVVLPMFLALIAIFVLLIMLQAGFMALTIFSPIAFALYALPNTEKYFKTWWDWLLGALMVYPIFMTIVGIADVFTVLILKANG